MEERADAGSRPSDGFVEHDTWPVADLRSLAPLRRRLKDAVASLVRADELDSRAMLTTMLVVSELGSNAVRHGRPPASVRLLSSGGTVVIDVVDHAPDDAPALRSRDDPAAADARPGGLGLMMVLRAADRLGWYVEDSAKHVWAQFDIRAA